MRNKIARKTLLAAMLLASCALGYSAARASIKTVFEEQPNGDYRLFIFGTNRALVCEEKQITVVQQGDDLNPIVIECSHKQSTK